MGCTVEAERHSTVEAERGELQIQTQEDRQGFEAHMQDESP